MYTEYVFENKNYEIALRDVKSILFDIVNEEQRRVNGIVSKVNSTTDDKLKERLITLCAKQGESLNALLEISNSFADTLKSLDSFSRDLKKIEKKNVANIIAEMRNAKSGKSKRQRNLVEGVEEEQVVDANASKEVQETPELTPIVEEKNDVPQDNVTPNEIAPSEPESNKVSTPVEEAAPVVTDTNVPPVEEAAPATDTSVIPVEEAAPATDTSVIPVEEAAPATDTNVIPVEEAAPATDTSVIPVEETAPATDTNVIPVEETAPATDTSINPVEEAAPATDTNVIPVETAPATDTSVTPVEAAAPATDTSVNPVEEAAPATDTNTGVVMIPTIQASSSKEVETTSSVPTVSVDVSNFKRVNNDEVRAILTSEKQINNLRGSLATQESLLGNMGFFDSVNTASDNALEQQLVQTGLLPADSSSIQAQIEQKMAQANQLYASGQIAEAQVLYDEISNLSKNLPSASSMTK